MFYLVLCVVCHVFLYSNKIVSYNTILLLYCTRRLAANAVFPCPAQRFTLFGIPSTTSNPKLKKKTYQNPECPYIRFNYENTGQSHSHFHLYFFFLFVFHPLSNGATQSVHFHFYVILFSAWHYLLSIASLKKRSLSLPEQLNMITLALFGSRWR